MPQMELRLEQLIDAVQVVANIDNLNAASPIVLRQYDAQHDRTVSIVCSIVEPTNMILPMNVVWIVFDKDSPFYKQALQRTSKNPKAPFVFSWNLLYFYDNVFTEQYYDPADIGDIPTEPVGVATETVAGTIALSVASSTPTNPVVISEGHHSLTDNRDPLTHTHEPRPAIALKASAVPAAFSIIDQPNPEIGMALVCNGPNFSWRKLVETDIDMTAGAPQ